MLDPENRAYNPIDIQYNRGTSLYRLLLAISSTFDSLFKVLFTFP